jgi:uncharacterized membrane protein YbhN (UPF0104 family)
MTQAKPRSWWQRRAIEAAIVVAFVGFLGWAMARQWPEVKDVVGQLSVAALVGSGLAAVAGIWLSMLSWKAILADFGSRVPLTGGMRVFFIGQAGKYVPGKVWPILAQVKLGRDYQVPGRASAAAVGIFMVIVLGSGLLVAVCLLPVVLGTGAFGSYWWALLALPAAAIVLWPPVLNRGLAWAMRLARREPMPRPLSAAGIARAVGWSLLMWLCYGVHFWVLLAALDAPDSNLLLATGGFAAAWCIGFMLLIAPAGLGPRELALVVLLSSTVTQPVVLVAAVVSRLLMTAGDLGWAVIALAIGRRQRERVAASQPDSA